MQRFTISLDDDLALQFDRLIANKCYVNRSEAVRDLIRAALGSATLDEVSGNPESAAPEWCVATVSFVYDHHEPAVTTRVLDLQHDHHDVVVTSLHTHLDHDHCLETAVLRGPTAAVRACGAALIALRGVRHGHVHLVPLDTGGPSHRHPSAGASAHRHFSPLT